MTGSGTLRALLAAQRRQQRDAQKHQRELERRANEQAKAVATEYMESVAIENDPKEKEKWIERQKALSDRQQKLDALRLPLLADSETDADEDET
jgi:hypothetical protein